PSANLFDVAEVASPDPEDNLFRCYLLRTCPLEECWEFAERAGAHVVQGSYFLAKLFVASGQHLRARKSQFTNDFREKCHLLDVRFDEEDLQVGPQNLQGQTWESGTRTNVGEPTFVQR